MKHRVAWALNRPRQDLENSLGIGFKMSTFIEHCKIVTEINLASANASRVADSINTRVRYFYKSL